MAPALVLSRRILPLVLIAAAGFCLLLQVADESTVSFVREEKAVDLPSNQEIKEAEGAANLAKRAFGLEEKSEKEADKAESAEVATAGFSSSLHDADTITALKAPPVVEEDEFKKPKTPPEAHVATQSVLKKAKAVVERHAKDAVKRTELSVQKNYGVTSEEAADEVNTEAQSLIHPIEDAILLQKDTNAIPPSKATERIKEAEEDEAERPSGAAVKASAGELKDLADANTKEEKEVSKAGKSTVSSTDVDAAERTAKAATEASHALAGAAGYADIASKHLAGSHSAAESPSPPAEAPAEEASQDEEALKELKAKPVKEAAVEEDHAGEPGTAEIPTSKASERIEDSESETKQEPTHKHATLEKISKVVGGGGSEEEKMKEVKEALEHHSGDSSEVAKEASVAPTTPAVLPATESKAADDVNKKMMESLERRNERWEKREQDPNTGYAPETKEGLSAVDATTIAARAAHTAETGAAGYAHIATNHLNAQVSQKKDTVALVQQISRTGASVMKDMMAEEEAAVKKEEAKLKKVEGGDTTEQVAPVGSKATTGKGFTNEEISDSKETATMARKAYTALHGSAGYATIAANTLAGKQEEDKVQAGTDTEVPEVPEDLEPDPMPEMKPFEPDKPPSPPKAPAKVPKTHQIKKVINGEGNEDEKIDKIKEIVKEEEEGEGGSGNGSGGTDPLAHPDEKEQDEDREGEADAGKPGSNDNGHAAIVKAHQAHLAKIKAKLAHSKSKIDNIANTEASDAAKAAVEARAQAAVKKETKDVAKVAEKTGVKPAEAEKVAVKAVDRAAQEHKTDFSQ